MRGFQSMTTDFLAQDIGVDESLDRFFDYYLSNLHTAMPAKIEQYDYRSQRASVKPVFVESYVGGDYKIRPTEYPVINNVPVLFQRGGGAFMTFPLKKDDLVLLLFTERTLDKWQEGQGLDLIKVTDMRMHHLSDAIAIPGLYPKGKPIKNIHEKDVVIGLDTGDSEIHITPSGEVQIKAGAVRLCSLEASQALALATGTKLYLDELKSNFNSHGHGTLPITGPPPIPNPLAPPIDPVTGLPKIVIGNNIASDCVFTNG
jgi:hypothetical protein